MIFTKQQSDLQHSINKMSVPVFVVDQDDDGEFRVVALNAAHTKATGLRLEAVLRKTPQMILPDKAEADFLTSRYQACVQQQRPVVYSTRLTYCDQAREIRTTLHPVSLDGQAPTRVVGQVAVSAAAPGDSVAAGPGIRATVDDQTVEAFLNDICRHQTISSKDLMMLAVLMNNRSLSMLGALSVVGAEAAVA